MEVFFDYPNGTSVLVTGASSPENAYQGALTHLAQVIPSDQASYELSGTGQSPNDEGRYEFGVSVNWAS